MSEAFSGLFRHFMPCNDGGALAEGAWFWYTCGVIGQVKGEEMTKRIHNIYSAVLRGFLKSKKPATSIPTRFVIIFNTDFAVEK